MFSLFVRARSIKSRAGTVRIPLNCSCLSHSRDFSSSNKSGSQNMKFKRKLVRNNYLITRNFTVNNNIERKASFKNKENNKMDNPMANLHQTISKHGRVFLDQIYKVLNSSLAYFSQKDADLLLKCCGHLLPDQLPEVRMALLDHVKETLTKTGAPFNYYLYISICTENQHLIQYEDVLVKVHKSDAKLYKLILENVCVSGDTLTAINILEEMKEQNIPADEEIFNSLVLVHAIDGGFDDANTVLETMRSIDIFPSVSTYVALLIGLAKGTNEKQFVSVVQLLPSNSLTEKLFLQVVQELSQNDNQDWMRHLFVKRDFTEFSKENLNTLDNLCIHLIYLEKPLTAIVLYSRLVQKHPDILDGNYGLFLLREMVKKGCSSKDILEAAKILKELNLNSMAHVKITETALRRNYHAVAWDLVKNLSPLRPHYFWSLLKGAFKENGEVGGFEALEKMINLGVKPDSESWEFYVLPHCDFSNPLELMFRLKKMGFTAKELFTPLIKVLLRNNAISEAAKLVTAYDGPIDASALSNLSRMWIINKNSENVVPVLQKICEVNSRQTDWTGQFLEKVCGFCKHEDDFREFRELLKIIKSKRLRLSSNSADVLSNIVKLKCASGELRKSLDELIDTLMDVSFKTEDQFIPHPREMNVEELEFHYEELENKNMETRGVLRRLIQVHSRLGNLSRVERLRNDFLSRGYMESPGMKANIFHSYVMSKKLPQAEKMFNEMKSKHPWFKLDVFKILDFATLMVLNGQEEKAVNLLKKETNVKSFIGSRGMEHNCVDLLKSFNDPDNQRKAFNVLVKLNYCKISTSILEPLVQIHLKCQNIDKAAQVFVDFVKKYKLFPAQTELLGFLMESDKHDLLQEVIKVVEPIDSNLVQISILEALAKNGMHKVLKKVILNFEQLPRDKLQTLCNNWAKKGQLHELKTLAKAVTKIPNNVIEKPIIYHAIMQIYSNNNDCELAVAFWESLEGEDDIGRTLLDGQLVSLLKRCKYDLPEGLKSKVSVAT